MKHKSEQLETYVLLSLTKFKNLEQNLQKAVNVSILKTDLSTPADSSIPASSPSPAPSESSEVGMDESSEPLPPSPYPHFLQLMSQWSHQLLNLSK